MSARLGGLFVFALVLLVPLSAVAEFGPESEDGYPISTEGQVMYPPVPAVRAPVAGPLNKVGDFTLYPYYPLLVAELQRLADEHPDRVRLTSPGSSTAGLPLWLLEIADFSRVESGEGVPLEDREVVYLDGGTHSNEYSGVYFVTEIAQFLLDEYETNETAKWIVENRHTWILPMVNVDGSNAFGRINAKGININRNFPGTWGTVEEDPLLNNPGPAPESEVETRIVTGLMDKLQPDYVNSIHCCGNLWLHPYGAEQLNTPADIQMYTRICDEAFADVRDRCGEIWNTIYPASGTTADEGYERIGASSWTYEMSGRGRVAGPWAEPVTAQSVRVQEVESWGGIMHAFLNVHKYGARPQVIDVSGDEGVLRVTVENVGFGNLTFGNVTLGGSTLALPWMAPNETVTLEFAGDFAAGPLELTVDWVKRERHMTPGLQTIAAQLVHADGGLRAVLPGLDGDVTPAAIGDEAPLSVPGAGAMLLVAGIAVVAIALRRR